jgi:pimeloyl-ACP methyl ester carboxylesterase
LRSNNLQLMATIKFKKKNINYTDTGKGKVIVLLHGFTESLAIWKHFATQLSVKYRVVTIDLPGHGKSESVEGVHSMELMAEVVYTLLRKLRVGKCLMIGHSMGGYVTLSFAAAHPEMLKGFGLFHSHCYADSPQEQENRTRTISIVNQDKFSFIAQFIPGLFPLEVHEKYAKEIQKLVQRAAKMHKDGVIAALLGMKGRKEMGALLRTTPLPVLFILGLKDPRAPVSRLWEMISMPAVSHTLLLRDNGHMGYIEAPEETLGAIQAFAKTYL